MARPMSPVTKFILGLPSTLSGPEVVAKAKEAGLSTDEKNVSRVRSRKRVAASGKTKTKAKTGPSRSAKKTAGRRGPRASSPGTQSPSDFVRSMPSATPAEIMAAAGKAGISFSRGLIYMVRSKGSAAKGGTKKRRAAKTKRTTAAVATNGATKTTAATGTMSKSDFIRSMPDAAPTEIVKAAKAAGLVFSVKYVSTIRANQRGAAKGGGRVSAATPNAAATSAKRERGRPRKTSSATPVTALSLPVRGDAESALRSAATAAVLAHGVAFAQTVLDGVIARIRAAGNG